MELNQETRLGKRNRGVGNLLQKINLAVKSSQYFRSSLSSLIDSNIIVAPSDSERDKSVSDQPPKQIFISPSKRSSGVNCARGDGISKTSYNPSTTFTMTPQLDGYVWRKYGEKKIVNSKFPRCYYRCTYYHELNCNATKQVQQYTDDESPMYKVTYFHEHTCNNVFLCNRNADNNCQNILDFTMKDASNSLGQQSASSSDGFHPVISSPNLQQQASHQGPIEFESMETDISWLDSYVMDELLSEHLMCE